MRRSSIAMLLATVCACSGTPSYPEFSLDEGISSSGVELGVADIQEVRRVLGAPQSDDLSDDGSVRALTFGKRYRFFFERDSIAVLAHVFETLSREEIERVLGAPLEEQRAPNLELWIRYADGVAVLYDALGERSKWIEYYRQVADSATSFPSSDGQ